MVFVYNIYHLLPHITANSIFGLVGAIILVNFPRSLKEGHISKCGGANIQTDNK